MINPHPDYNCKKDLHYDPRLDDRRQPVSGSVRDLIHCFDEEAVMKQAGLFGLSDHLKRLSANGDPLEELGRIVNFEAFRPILDNALGYSDGTKGGRARARHAPGMAALSPPMIRWRCSKY